MNKQEFLKKLETSKRKAKNSGQGVVHCLLAEIIKLVEQLDEPQHPVVKQCVADWFEEHKDDLGFHIWNYIRKWDSQDKNSEFFQWFDDEPESFKILTRMVDGYEIEKESLYVVQKDNDYISYVSLGRRDYEKKYTKNKELAIKLKKEQAEAFAVVFGGEAVEG